MELAGTLNCLGLDFEQQKDKFNEAICFRELTKSCIYRKSGDGAGDTVTSRDISEMFRTVLTLFEKGKMNNQWMVVALFCAAKLLGQRMRLHEQPEQLRGQNIEHAQQIIEREYRLDTAASQTETDKAYIKFCQDLIQTIGFVWNTRE